MASSKLKVCIYDRDDVRVYGSIASATMMRRTFSSAPFHPLRSWQAPVRALPHPSPRFVRQGAPIARRQYAGWEQPERRGLWGAFLAYSRVHPIRAGAAIFVYVPPNALPSCS